MNKMFGTNIHINFVPGADMARIGNQLATEYSAGQKAACDIMLGAAPQIAPLVKARYLRTGRMEQLPAVARYAGMTEVGGKLIRMVTGLSGVTYNSSLAPMKPSTLEDFLKPEWKGKIASTPYAAGFDVLLATDVWGKEKTLDYVEKLSHQIAGLIRCGEAERIATGEYLALVMDCTGQDALQWQEKGAPLAQMMPLDAAQERYYYFGIPKNAQHPNAAKLYHAVSADRGGTEALLRHLEDRSAHHAWLAHGQDGRRFRQTERQIQGSHDRMVSPAPRDRCVQERIDQNHHDQELMSLRNPRLALRRGVQGRGSKA